MSIILVFIEKLSLICSLCLRVMGIPLYMQHSPALTYTVCGYPESGTDHSLKRVSALIIL